MQQREAEILALAKKGDRYIKLSKTSRVVMNTPSFTAMYSISCGDWEGGDGRKKPMNGAVVVAAGDAKGEK